MKKFLILLFISGIVLAWIAPLKAETKPPLAMLPFFFERLSNPARGTVLCPLCKGVFETSPVPSTAVIYLSRLLYQKMDVLDRFRITPVEKVEETLTPPMKEQFEEKPFPTAVQIGKELDADFILVAYLFRFEQRIGSRIGAEKPASVGFDVHLIRLRDEKIVWTGRFNETQRPLSENLLNIGSFFRRKASWLTAEELSSVGMDEMLKKLPEAKELEEKP